MSVTMTSVVFNSTYGHSTAGSSTQSLGSETGDPLNSAMLLFCSAYAAICLVGLAGNGLVIFVVLRYAKMKTVTNTYILNLAVADLAFLVGLPFLIATALLGTWNFGHALCKLFYVLTSINWFTSVFTLTVMSADRYLAVCHPVRSIAYRTPSVSRAVCISVWCLSLLVMLPIILYARTVSSDDGRVSCTIDWPSGQLVPAEKAFIWYALLLGFAIPVALISVFYALVLLRLKTVGPTKKSKEMRRSHRRVTKMVLTVIAVYVVCWLPYWVFQVVLTFGVPEHIPSWCIKLFQFFTLLSYANSVLNPILYAFLSENFRKSFVKAFACASQAEANTALNAADHSLFPVKQDHGDASRTATQLSLRRTRCAGVGADGAALTVACVDRQDTPTLQITAVTYVSASPTPLASHEESFNLLDSSAHGDH